MGVPAFFRWLTEKYPRVISDVLEERLEVDPGDPDVLLPFDGTASPNPNGLEVDALYVDMNGIIHPCSHPENGPAPASEREMYDAVCAYVARLVRALRPRRTLFLAVDGVAPRAKMNQQRARRFRSAQEAREAAALKRTAAEELGVVEEEDEEERRAWDSNVITPGTDFMRRLSDHVRAYVERRQREDPSWRRLRVHLSDASVPGEGEHKIISHVRRQRSSPRHDPNTVHVLHGLDADLIMLALATHEAHFYVSREEVVFGRYGEETARRRREASGFETRQRELDDRVSERAMAHKENRHKRLVLLSVPVLREYLSHEFSPINDALPFAGEVSFERVIDDLVFLCFFVGNDFLPHLPSLDIREGGLDFLLNVYKRALPTLGDYLTDHGGVVNLANVDVVLDAVGEIEDHVFRARHEDEERRQHGREAAKERRAARRREGVDASDPRAYDQVHGHGRGRAAEVMRRDDGNDDLDELGRARPPKRLLKRRQEGKAVKRIKARAESFEEPPPPPRKTPEEVQAEKERRAALVAAQVKRLESERLDALSSSVVDNVRLHEPGWKTRYYADKCKADDVEGGGGREHMFRSYVKGLCWVMRYYYEGCVSWRWYYPFHYAPFASDLRNCERFEEDCRTFELGRPFSPVEQLMSVLPNDSAHAVPESCRWLMSDPESPILDFYPREVLCDPNGKKMPWLWVVLLPFLDETRLLDALAPTRRKWSERETANDARGPDDGWLFVHESHPLHRFVRKVLDKGRPRSLDKAGTDLSGTLRPPPDKDDEESADGVTRVVYAFPPAGDHRSALAPGVELPPPTLTSADLAAVRPPRLSRGGPDVSRMGGVAVDERHGGGMRVDRRTREAHRGALPTGMREWGSMDPSQRRRPRHRRWDEHGNEIPDPFRARPPPPPPPRPHLFGHDPRRPPPPHHHPHHLLHHPFGGPPPSHPRFAAPPPPPPPPPPYFAARRPPPPPPAATAGRPATKSGLDPRLVSDLRSKLTNTLRQNRRGGNRS